MDVTTLLTDSQLVSRSRVDPAAFGVLFDRHAVAVHRFLARRGGRQLADDLLTEVFATALSPATATTRRTSRPGPGCMALP